MSGDRFDLTGLWEGTFVYPAYEGPTTPFVANLIETDGKVTGTTIEPGFEDVFGQTGELHAAIAGARTGRTVDFIKSYDGQVVDDVVDYVGQMSADGASITGVWSNNDMDGSFEMHRDLKFEDLAVAEEEAELTEPVVPDSLVRGSAL